MKSLSPIEQLKIEKLAKRTTEGWPIRETGMKAVEDSSVMPEEYIGKLGCCLNCGLVVNQKFFHAGCPNCNAKDVRMLD